VKGVQTDRVSRLASSLQKLGHYPWFARVGRAYVPVDRALGRLTKGRFVAFGSNEIPSMLITTVGRQTGKSRTVPLLYMPDGDGFVVMASNWGQAHHPAWALNLLAHPTASVMAKGRTVRVTATLATGAERDRLLDLMLSMWPAYATYQERAANRTIKIFRLTPSA
jgi:deazaflavin-dependent oxidoreductase (nitroreductase family)